MGSWPDDAAGVGVAAGLLERDYTTHQMAYDLRRLRLHGLIERIPRTHRYTLTPTASASTTPTTPDSPPRETFRKVHQPGIELR